ncbi:MAG: FAD-dependent oxidoreductase [Clostridia bacterium]|nr:FAD-dependent oxidoreductase [Clostridia bacterium]
MYDIIIIGGGPAGLTAALYGVRSGRRVLLFEKTGYGGQIAKSPLVENYPGIRAASGMELSEILRGQAESFGCEFRKERVLSVTDGDIKKITTSKGEYEARAVIFALGTEERMLGLENEEKYVGRGLSYCAYCDGNFFRNREVAVIGGGNTAVQDALYLSDICKKIYLVHRRNEFRAESSLVEKARLRENIEFVTDSVPVEIGGTPIVQCLKVKNKLTEVERELSVNGVFAAIGQIPQTKEFSDILPLDEGGYVIAGEDCTVRDGIYVCGDCRKKEIRQLTTAVSDGTVAATKAVAFVG